MWSTKEDRRKAEDAFHKELADEDGAETFQVVGIIYIDPDDIEGSVIRKLRSTE